MVEDLVIALADLREQTALGIVRDRLRSGEGALSILADAARAMEIVGRRFAEGEYFIPDLVYSGEVMREITELARPSLRAQEGRQGPLGKFLIGTLAADIHDIGKDIVAFKRAKGDDLKYLNSLT